MNANELVASAEAEKQLSLTVDLVKWNRSLDEPLIKIAYEGDVALKVLELIRKAQKK
jgi:hypothetical protein